MVSSLLPETAVSAATIPVTVVLLEMVTEGAFHNSTMVCPGVSCQMLFKQADMAPLDHLAEDQ